MARCVHQIQHIGFAILCGIVQTNRLRLDGNTSLTLDIHIVQDLFFHLAVSQPTTKLNQPVGNGGFSMVNMGND